jgi:hypothetical protein
MFKFIIRVVHRGSVTSSVSVTSGSSLYHKHSILGDFPSGSASLERPMAWGACSHLVLLVPVVAVLFNLGSFLLYGRFLHTCSTVSSCDGNLAPCGRTFHKSHILAGHEVVEGAGL